MKIGKAENKGTEKKKVIRLSDMVNAQRQKLGIK